MLRSLEDEVDKSSENALLDMRDRGADAEPCTDKSCTGQEEIMNWPNTEREAGCTIQLKTERRYVFHDTNEEGAMEEEASSQPLLRDEEEEKAVVESLTSFSVGVDESNALLSTRDQGASDAHSCANLRRTGQVSNQIAARDPENEQKSEQLQFQFESPLPSYDARSNTDPVSNQNAARDPDNERKSEQLQLQFQAVARDEQCAANDELTYTHATCCTHAPDMTASFRTDTFQSVLFRTAVLVALLAIFITLVLLLRQPNQRDLTCVDSAKQTDIFTEIISKIQVHANLEAAFLRSRK